MAGLLTERMYSFMRFLIALVLLMPAQVENINGQTNNGTCRKSISLLKQAAADGKNFFIKVHAAENLIYHHHPEGLETEFLQLQKASPDYMIGSARVLARLNRRHPAGYRKYTGQLLYQFKQGATSAIQLTALESLGKLGYREALPAIRNRVDTGTNGFRAMACWIMSNNGTAADENRLSALLLSGNAVDYRYAAYALRFKVKTNALTIDRLQQCLQNLQADDAARVYVAACLFVHSAANNRLQAKKVLLSYTSGDAGQRYEVAEALGLAGSRTDLPALQILLADENMDVQVAAANALLKLIHCKS